jgi:hypothetical protein
MELNMGQSIRQIWPQEVKTGQYPRAGGRVVKNNAADLSHDNLRPQAKNPDNSGELCNASVLNNVIKCQRK